MSLTQIGPTLSFSIARIAKKANGDLVVYDYATDGGAIFTIRNGVETEVANNLVGKLGGQFSGLQILSDGAFLLYRQDFEAGGASFAVVNADGSVRLPITSAASDGDGMGNTENIAGPSATATANGGFFFAVTDRTYANTSVPATFTDDDGSSSTGSLARGNDVAHRYYTSSGAPSGAYVTDNIGDYDNGGTTTNHTAGNQQLSGALTLSNGTVIEAYLDQVYFEQHTNNNNSQNVVSMRLVTPGGTSAPFQVNTDPLTSDISSPSSHNVDGAGGVQLVSLGSQGFAVLWNERDYEYDPSVYGNYRQDGYDTKIRYFDLNGNALTGEISVIHHDPANGNFPINVGADALSDGRIALIYQEGVYGVNGTAAGRLFEETIGSMGSSLSTTALTPPSQSGTSYANWDLKALGGNQIGVTYANGGGGGDVVQTFAVGNSTNVVSFGTDADETIRGSAGDDMLYGMGGNDSLVGYGGDDTLNGGAGNDIINGGAGVDTMIGGVGNDRFYVDNARDSVLENVGEGVDTVYASVDWTMTAGQEIEYLRANAGSTGLHLTGNAFANTLVGGAGDDTLNGGGGADILIGGAGNDTYVIDNAGVSVRESAGAGTDTVLSSVSYALPGNVENLTLTGANAINGYGNVLANVITGNNATNYISGGGGDDILTGGGGADVFVYAAGFGRDTITDFAAGSAAGHDAFRMSSSLFASYADVMAHTSNSAGGAVIAYDPSDTITLSSVSKASLVAADFRFV